MEMSETANVPLCLAWAFQHAPKSKSTAIGKNYFKFPSCTRP